MVCSPNSQDPLWDKTFRSIMNANIVTSMCCFLVGKVGFGGACLVARFCDQYGFVLCFSKPLQDHYLKKKNSPDRSLDLSGEFLVVMRVGLDFTRAP